MFRPVALPGWFAFLLSQGDRIYRFIDAWSNLEFVRDKWRSGFFDWLGAILAAPKVQVGLILFGLLWIAVVVLRRAEPSRPVVGRPVQGGAPLRIEAGTDERYDYEFPYTGSGEVEGYRLFRVRILNASERTLDEVQVSLESIDPQATPALPVPLRLHLKDDNVEPYKQGFSLAPCGEQFIDVVPRADLPGTKRYFEIQHVVNGVANRLPVGKYRIMIAASARDVRVVRRPFELGVREKRDGELGVVWDQSYFRPLTRS